MDTSSNNSKERRGKIILCALHNNAFNDREAAKAASSEIGIMMHKQKLRRPFLISVTHFHENCMTKLTLLVLFISPCRQIYGLN
jgi:hypothetical protein